MTTFRTACPHCGEISLLPEAIELYTFPEATDRYFFDCPECGDRIEKPADVRIVRLLKTGGVEPIDQCEHPERFDPESPPLTPEDFLNFFDLLEDDASLAEAVDKLPKE